jgi:hypothetical protein
MEYQNWRSDYSSNGIHPTIIRDNKMTRKIKVMPKIGFKILNLKQKHFLNR